MGTERDDKRWLKVKELAQREGVTARTVRRWMEKDAVEVRRLARATGVRVRARDA
jgi:DNA-binding transcriptional MerR regulator